MAGFIPVFSAVHHWLQQWKNYWNRSVFAKVMHQRITAYFFDPYICMLLIVVVRSVNCRKFYAIKAHSII